MEMDSLTEIRVQSSGFGYKKNLAKDKNVRCIIDAFTILSPGSGYTVLQQCIVNGELGVQKQFLMLKMDLLLVLVF